MSIRLWRLVIIVVLLALVAAACSPRTPEPAATAAPTATVPPSATALPTNTSTEAPPSATALPTESASATPAEQSSAAPPATTAAPTQAPLPTATIGAALPDLTLVQQYCTACHSVDRILAARKTAAEWQLTVARMVAKGANLTATQQTIVATLLAKAFPK
jgi:hypothetical protein